MKSSLTICILASSSSFTSCPPQTLSSPSGRVNTTVVLRCRPLLENEKKSGIKPILACSSTEVRIAAADLVVPSKQDRVFHFDKVFNEEASQAEVYNSVVAPIIQRVLKVCQTERKRQGCTGF